MNALRRSVWVGVLLLAAWPALGQRVEDIEKLEAYRAAVAWLDLIDQGQYEESWDAGAQLMHLAMPREDWTQGLDRVFSQLGGLVQREFKEAQFTDTLPGAPKGAYVILQFHGTYQSARLVETLTFVQEGEAWKAGGYFVTPL